MDVVRCATHRLAFTIYPPGHVPYGRTPLIELAPDGSALSGGGTEARPATTLLVAAASDAASGTRWPREGASTAAGVRSTQHRHVARAAALLGLVAGAPPAAAVVANLTGLPEGQLVEVAARLAPSQDLSAWGREVTGVAADLTKAVNVPRALMDRLAVLGHLAGRWGRPYRWLAGPRRLLEIGRRLWSSVLPGTGTHGGGLASGGSFPFNDFGSRGPP